MAFVGWTGTDLDTKTIDVTISKGSTGDRSYTANWAAGVPTSIDTYQYNTEDDYMYFGHEEAEWKSTDDIRDSWRWFMPLPSLEFDRDVTRARLGFSTSGYVTYNSQSDVSGFVSLDKRRMWFANGSGYPVDGYYTVGYTIDSIDHEIRLRVQSGEITETIQMY